MESSHLPCAIQKKNIRLWIKNKIDESAESDLRQSSHLIEKNFLNWDCFLKSKSLFLYISANKEVHTHKLIKASLSGGKKVLIPRVMSNKQIKVYQLNDFDKDLEVGSYGILEPKLSCQSIDNPCGIELFVLPGVAFTKRGERLGRGGGYFDRFLESELPGKKICLAYDFQIVDELPLESHDRKVDGILTEKQFYWS